MSIHTENAVIQVPIRLREQTRVNLAFELCRKDFEEAHAILSAHTPLGNLKDHLEDQARKAFVLADLFLEEAWRTE